MTDPVILTSDDLCRLFAAVASVMDTTPGMRFDPETQRVIAVVRSLVVATPAPAGPGHWSSHVLPFVIQNPLPEMPKPPLLTVVPNAEGDR